MKKYIHSFSVTCGLYFTVVIFIQSFINVETEPFDCCFPNETTTEYNDSTTLTRNYSQPCCLTCALSDSVNCSDLNPDFLTLVSYNVSECQLPSATLPSTIIYTTSTEATTSETVSNTSRTSTQPQPTTTTSDSEDEGTVTLCVLQCPKTHYPDKKRQCQPCNPLCNNCTEKGIKSQTCECKYGHNGTHCCQEGFQEDIQGNMSVCIKIKQPEDTPDNLISIIIGAVVGGVAVLVVLIVVIVCFVCRRHQTDSSSGRQRRPISELLHNKSKKKKKASQLPSVEEVDTITSSQAQTGLARRPPGYENTATIDHRRVAECAQHEQDKKGRYTKDPTAKKEKKKAKEEDNSPTEIYENQSTIDRQKQLKFEKDKKPGRFQKLSMKFRKSKPLKLQTPDPNLPTDTYEEMEGAAGDNNMPTEVYEAALDEHMPQEEYEAMDKKTMEAPQEEYMPMNPQGVDNSAFSVSENPYANVQFRSADSNEPTEDYENFQLKQCDDQPVYGNVG